MVRMAIKKSEKLKKRLREKTKKFLQYVETVIGKRRRGVTYFNYADFRHIAKDLEGKKKSAFVKKAKRFFAMHKKLDAQITKALKKPE